MLFPTEDKATQVGVSGLSLYKRNKWQKQKEKRREREVRGTVWFREKGLLSSDKVLWLLALKSMLLLLYKADKSVKGETTRRCAMELITSHLLYFDQSRSSIPGTEEELTKHSQQKISRWVGWIINQSLSKLQKILNHLVCEPCKVEIFFLSLFFFCKFCPYFRHCWSQEQLHCEFIVW